MYSQTPTTSEFFKPYDNVDKSTIDNSEYVHVVNNSDQHYYINVLHPQHKLGYITGLVTNCDHSGSTTELTCNLNNILTDSHYLTSSHTGYYSPTFVCTGEKNGKCFYETQGPIVLFYEPEAFFDGGAWVVVSKLDYPVWGDPIKYIYNQDTPQGFHYYFKTNSKSEYPDFTDNWEVGSANIDNSNFSVTYNLGPVGNTNLDPLNQKNVVWLNQDSSADIEKNFIVYKYALESSGFPGTIPTNKYKSYAIDNWQDSANPRQYYVETNNKYFDQVSMSPYWQVKYKRSAYTSGFGTTNDVFIAQATIDSNDTVGNLPETGWTTLVAPNPTVNFTVTPNITLDTGFLPKAGMRLYANDEPATGDSRKNLTDPYQDIYVQSASGSSNAVNVVLNKVIGHNSSNPKISNQQSISFGYEITPRILGTVALLPKKSITIKKQAWHEISISAGPHAIANPSTTSPVIVIPVKKPLLV